MDGISHGAENTISCSHSVSLEDTRSFAFGWNGRAGYALELYI
jgi:hypothetical protein